MDVIKTLMEDSALVYPPLPDPHLTRQTLLLRLRPDSPAREVAWREFHEQYSPIIAGFARKMGAKQQDISDLIQDAMLGFFAVSPEFVYDPLKGRFRGYLKTCVWRLFKRRVGKQMRVGGRLVEDIDPADLQVEETWNDVWESEKLQRAMEVVRNRYLARSDMAKTFRAFEMYVLLERDASAVAGELGMTTESVHQAKTRISKALRVEMDALDQLAG